MLVDKLLNRTNEIYFQGLSMLTSKKSHNSH
jgi:hypothetical protein